MEAQMRSLQVDIHVHLGVFYPCSPPQETTPSHFTGCVEMWGKGRKRKSLAT